MEGKQDLSSNSFWKPSLSHSSPATKDCAEVMRALQSPAYFIHRVNDPFYTPHQQSTLRPDSAVDCIKNENDLSDLKSSFQWRDASREIRPDPSQISPKTSITSQAVNLAGSSKHVESLGALVTRSSNPTVTEFESTSASSPAKAIVLAPKDSQRKSSRNFPGQGFNRAASFAPGSIDTTDEISNGKITTDISLKNRRSTSSYKVTRKFSSGSTTASLSPAIFVNFTSKDSKKLLSGVAPSGSSKRKKTLSGSGFDPKKNDPASSSGMEVVVIKKRKTLDSST